MSHWTKALATLAGYMDSVPISSQQQHDGSKPSVIPVLRNPMPLLMYPGTRYACCPQIYMQAKSHKYKNKFKNLANKLNNISTT